MPYDHEQVEVEGVLVDKGMAPLLKELWRLGYHTVFSCEDNDPPGFAWIQFRSVESGLIFVGWLLTFLPSMDNVKDDVRIRVLGKNHQTCGVRFPNKHLKSLTTQFRRIDSRGNYGKRRVASSRGSS